jgi:predicted nucleic acid-binding protein
MALDMARKEHCCCAGHAIAQVYSTLTRMPGQHRAGPEEALLFLNSIRSRFQFVSLSPDQYWAVVSSASESGIVGGRVYDALPAACAIKAKAEIIYTWDVTDFRQLGADIEKRVRTPRFT